MALQYEIKEANLTAGSLSSVGPRSISNSQIATFKILVSDDVAPLQPYEISEQQVIEDTVGIFNVGGLGVDRILYQIPKLNEDVLTVLDVARNIQINPWLYCTNKRCQRDPQNRLLFNLACEFSTGNRRSLDENELYLIDAVDTSAELPFLKENIWGMDEIVLWEERTTGSPLQLRLPTGNQFSEPFMSKLAKRTIRQTQFEEIATEDELFTKIEERLFSLPSDNWPTDGTARPPETPPRWMIMAIDYQKTRIRTSAGSWLDGYMLTYTLDYKTPAPPSDGGFYDRRALIDNYFNTTADDPNSRTAWFDENGGNAIVTGPLEESGVKRPFDQPYVYKDFKVQPEQAWYITPTSGFLRTETPQP